MPQSTLAATLSITADSVFNISYEKCYSENVHLRSFEKSLRNFLQMNTFLFLMDFSSFSNVMNKSIVVSNEAWLPCYKSNTTAKRTQQYAVVERHHQKVASKETISNIWLQCLRHKWYIDGWLVTKQYYGLRPAPHSRDVQTALCSRSKITFSSG